MKRILPLLSLIALAGAAPAAIAADWPHFQGPGRDGRSDETGLKLSGWKVDAPPVGWEKKLNEGFGGAAIAGGEVFLLDRREDTSDVLLCLSLEDGS